MNEHMQTRELPAGTVIKLAGFPVELTAPVVVSTHQANWPLIDETLAALTEAPSDRP